MLKYADILKLRPGEQLGKAKDKATGFIGKAIRVAAPYYMVYKGAMEPKRDYFAESKEQGVGRRLPNAFDVDWDAMARARDNISNHRYGL